MRQNIDFKVIKSVEYQSNLCSCLQISFECGLRLVSFGFQVSALSSYACDLLLISQMLIVKIIRWVEVFKQFFLLHLLKVADQVWTVGVAFSFILHLLVIFDWHRCLFFNTQCKSLTKSFFITVMVQLFNLVHLIITVFHLRETL